MLVHILGNIWDSMTKKQVGVNMFIHNPRVNRSVQGLNMSVHWTAYMPTLTDLP